MLDCGWKFRFGKVCGKGKDWVVAQSGANALGSLSGPRSLEPNHWILELPCPIPLLRPSPRGHRRVVCPLDENSAGQLDIFPEGWMGTEPPQNILGQISLLNPGCQSKPGAQLDFSNPPPAFWTFSSVRSGVCINTLSLFSVTGVCL